MNTELIAQLDAEIKALEEKKAVALAVEAGHGGTPCLQSLVAGESEMEELTKLRALLDEVKRVLGAVAGCKLFYEESMDIDNHTTDDVNNLLTRLGSMSESQTPRTDAAERDQEDRAEYRGYLVPARFARELETELTATRARLAKIEEAARADEADLEKMRDGTKLTRAGVVMALQFLQDENEEFRARLAELEGIAGRLYQLNILSDERIDQFEYDAATDAYEAYRDGKK